VQERIKAPHVVSRRSGPAMMEVISNLHEFIHFCAPVKSQSTNKSRSDGMCHSRSSEFADKFKPCAKSRSREALARNSHHRSPGRSKQREPNQRRQPD
jgi:hypothetical protein